MPFQRTVLSSRTQSWSSSYGVNLFLTPFDAQSTCSDAECRGGPREERFRLNAVARNAMSMPSLGVNVVSIGASILMSSFTSKNKKETSRRTDSAQSFMQQLCVTARVQPLVRWHGHSLVSTHSLGKNFDYALAAVCGSMHASSHLCVGMGIRLCKITRRTHLSRNSVSAATKWEMSAPQLSQKL